MSLDPHWAMGAYFLAIIALTMAAVLVWDTRK